MTTLDLSPDVGRVLALDEAVPTPSWLIQGLVPESGYCAIGVTLTSTRIALGIQLVRSLTGDRGVSVLGHFGHTTRALTSVVVLATSEVVARRYRAVCLGDDRVQVVALRPWQGGDPDYFHTLRTALTAADAVLIDNVNNIPNGGAPSHLGRLVAELHDCVIGLLVGNATGIGVGGEQLWADAIGTRFFLDARKSSLTSIDDPEQRAVQVQVPVLAQVATPAPRSITEQQVHDLGEAGRWFDRRGGPQARAVTLLSEALPSVRSICGREPSQAELAIAIERHANAFALGEAGRPLDYEPPDELGEPPF